MPGPVRSAVGAVNRIERIFRCIDAFQQAHGSIAFVVALTKKYGDDNAGVLTVQLAYSLFTTIFPLLLLLDTALALILASHPGLRHAVLHSAFAQFPIVGSKLAENIHVMKRNSLFGFAVGIIGLLYGSTGLAGAGMYAMEQIWNIPGAVRPSCVKRVGRSFTFLAVLGIGLVVTTFLSSFGTFGSHEYWYGVGAEALAAACNVGLYLAAFRVLTPRQVASRDLVLGAAFGGIAWSVLQATGSYVVGHYLRDDNAVYAMFGTVLGLLAWIYIGAEVTVYAAELNTVVKRHLWPRGMVQPPLTAADQNSIALQAIENQRRPEQEVVTRVRGRPMPQSDYLVTGGHIDEADAAVVGTERRVLQTGQTPASSAEEPPRPEPA